MDILLTTYPEHGSRNVGDGLISMSALKLICARAPEYNPLVIFREESLDKFDKSKVRSIVAPGFSVKDGTYPELFKLYKNLDGVSSIFHPVGCSFQHFIPSKETYEKYVYSEDTVDFLKYIASGSGSLPCRDELIVKMLHKHGVPAFYCGDLALYDENLIRTEFTPPRTISSIAFTVQHKTKFTQQSFELLHLIKEEFPSSNLYVVHHSKINEHSQKISDYAKSLGYIERDLSGHTDNLEFYNNIDLHIGYRLHGHISFLRRRKPSFLLVEDLRSFGIVQTKPLGIGSFLALDESGVKLRSDVPKQVVDHIRMHLANKFSDFNRVFNFIDSTFLQVVKPYFDVLVSKISK